MSKFLEQPSTNKKNHFILNNYLTNNQLGVFTVVMLFSNSKIITKFLNLKTTFIKTGIVLTLTAYWGVILVGTFITFN